MCEAFVREMISWMIPLQNSMDEMEKKKERIMLMSLQRRQRQEEMKERKEAEAQTRREQEKLKAEERARKKEEERQRRAAILEHHKVKKAIEEAEREVSEYYRAHKCFSTLTYYTYNWQFL